MQKISALKITRLTVSGFKCFADERSFALDDITYITGSNHVGKSSIADAIAFAFTGKLFNGDSAMDRLYSEGSGHLKITLELLDEHGNPHVLIRVRRDDKMSIVFDSMDIRQKDLDVLFGESDVFLAILNPTFFIERLGSDGQKLLQTYLPVIRHEAVLARLSEHQQTLLENQPMLSPDTFIKSLREEIREDQESIIALDGQKALLLKQRQNGQKNLAVLEQQIGSLQQEIDLLGQKRESGINFAVLDAQRTELLLRRDELLSDRPQEPRTAQVDLNIQRAAANLEADKQREYSSKYTAEMTKLQAELQVAGDEYRKVYAVFENIRAGVRCPTCMRPVTSENLEDTKSGLNQSLQEMMRQGLEKNVQLAQIKELNQKAKEVFDQWKSDDLAKQQERLAMLHQQRSAILAQPEDYATTFADLQKQIQDVETALDMGALTAEERLQLGNLDAKRDALTAELGALKTLLAQPEPDVDGQKKQLEDDIRVNTNLISAALDYLGICNELTFQNLPLGKVAFSLYDIIKTTGEVKNIFRFTYHGRDYRKLSHSEKIFAGMEVSELMKTLTGRNYPVFVDDSESVVSLAQIPSGQIFLSRVIPKQPITVTGKGRQPEALLKAS